MACKKGEEREKGKPPSILKKPTILPDCARPIILPNDCSKAGYNSEQFECGRAFDTDMWWNYWDLNLVAVATV